MKKLKLNELNLGTAEVLTREQLKKVLGGDGGSGGSGDILCEVYFPNNPGSPEITFYCSGGEDLYQCTMDCEQYAESYNGFCAGCGQFPG